MVLFKMYLSTFRKPFTFTHADMRWDHGKKKERSQRIKV